METLRLSSERAGDNAIRVVVAGELDMASAPKIEEELRSVEQQDPSVILLDLRELDFMDSSGLRAILTADARARDQGRRLVVIRGSENIQRLFAVTRLDERMEIVDDPEDLGL
jgi:anti-anti-sigma factor